jgi:hypothetical protein
MDEKEAKPNSPAPAQAGSGGPGLLRALAHQQTTAVEMRLE